MRVALCFYGQPRHIENPHTWMSHNYWIIDRYNADVFAHTWINNKQTELTYSDWADNDVITYENEKSSEIILNRYKFKNYIFEKSKQFELSNESREIIKEKEEIYNNTMNGEFHYSLNNENNTLSQLYSVSKVIKLLENEDKYDWVILSRYDNYIMDFPNLYQLNNDALYLDNRFLSSFSDLIILGGQEHIKSFDCFDNIHELCKDISYFTPEEFKRAAYHKKFNNFTPIPDMYNYTPGEEIRIEIKVRLVKSDTVDEIFNNE